MPSDESTDVLSQFRQTLDEVRQLYFTSGLVASRDRASLGDKSPQRFIDLMGDLHAALLVKIFVSVGQCDHSWSQPEQELACVLVDHLWRRQLKGDELREAILEMADKALKLNWYALVRPFDQIPALRNRVSELETLVVRLAHLVARADGEIKPVEAASLKSIQDELRAHLRPIPIDEPDQHASAGQAKAQAVEKVFTTAEQLPPRTRSADSTPATPSQESLAEALAELESLVGLATIKEEIRTLTNFLKVQAQRTKAGLPAATLSLHMIFGGNPGTGKTSVARIVGRIFGAMGVLKRGHLVETDRSGLVAAYAGQTSPKTHQLIDEALDGVLFIDEAYSLIHPEGDDPYGQEAVQVLLKRMEDDRERLVVILAGYPTEMQSLIDSNPGLASRFNRQLQFTDYTPLELAHIFSQMCDKNRYRLGALARATTILGLTWLYRHRDERFGNGRAVRNLFEQTIRRQANRIADMKDLSLDELTALEAADIEFVGVPLQALHSPNDEVPRFRIECPHCSHAGAMPAQYLGQTVRCPKCREPFTAEWGEVAE